MTRVVAIALDAAEGTLALRWAREGKLPVLAGLLERGGVARLRSDAVHLPESIWPTTLTGCVPPTHGVYSWREIAPGTYQRRRRPMRCARQPFWELMRDGAAPASGPPRVLLLDVPFAPHDGDPSTTAVFGWGQRGSFRRESHPDGLLEELERRHGGYVRNLNRDVAGRPLLERSQLRSMTRMARRRTAVLRDLMAEHSWDVCIAPYFEPHYAGHAFHQYAAREQYIDRVPRGVGLGDALLRVYQAVDAGIGELIEAAPADTTFAVFSGFGLRPNTNGTELLPRLLERLGYTVPAPLSRESRRRELLRRAALTVIPRPLARAVRRRTITPAELDRHAERLWLESTDWSRSRAWAETEPGSAWIRLNVAGREPTGIVQPGREYDELCAEIAAELGELTDARTGEPAVDAVMHRDELGRGANVDRLPDLLVHFSLTTVVKSARHPRVGTVHDDRAGWKVTEHDDDGFLVLAGPSVAAGADAGDARVEDLAPTLMHLLGGAVPSDLDGRPLTELLLREPRVRRSFAA